MNEDWGYFLIRRFENKQNCSSCYNAFRGGKCLDLFVYKCLCKGCNLEEIMCRFCAQYTQKYIHLCKCQRNIERHLCDNLPAAYDLVNKGFVNVTLKLLE